MVEKANNTIEKETIRMYKKRQYMAKFQILAITLLWIAVFALIGYMIDQHFEKTPLYTLACVCISYPLSQIHLYSRFKNISSFTNGH